MDLLWPPKQETIKHPDRFVLMFAPLNRSYYEPFDPAGLSEPVPPFVLNQLTFPPSQNLNFLAAWQKVFSGDSFVYDYRFMWGQYDDPGYMQIAPATALDIPALAKVGLGGMISDQTQRAFLPSGLAMTVLARKLWQSDLSYDAIADDYFAAAFGADGPECRKYLEQISEGFNPRWMSTYSPTKNPAVPDGTQARLAQVRQTLAGFRPVIDRNSRQQDLCRAQSWTYLAFHADVCELLAQALEAEVRGDRKAAVQSWQRLQRMVIEREGEVHPAFDVFLFLLSMKQKHPFYILKQSTP